MDLISFQLHFNLPLSTDENDFLSRWEIEIRYTFEKVKPCSVTVSVLQQETDESSRPAPHGKGTVSDDEEDGRATPAEKEFISSFVKELQEHSIEAAFQTLMIPRNKRRKLY
jgi:hypothetical protein